MSVSLSPCSSSSLQAAAGAFKAQQGDNLFSAPDLMGDHWSVPCMHAYMHMDISHACRHVGASDAALTLPCDLDAGTHVEALQRELYVALALTKASGIIKQHSARAPAPTRPRPLRHVSLRIGRAVVALAEQPLAARLGAIFQLLRAERNRQV